MDDLVVTDRDGGARFAVRVVPRSKRAGIDGVHAGALKLRVTAPPVDGAANEAVIAAIARGLGVAQRDVEIVGGATARTKSVVVRGITGAAVRAKLSSSVTPR